ncbi:proheparin-binding EGF-like growth factor [Gastrophryne carolinensis]
MKLMNILMVILIEGLVFFVFLHGAVIGSNQNEIFSKGTDEMAAGGERSQHNDKRHITSGNHILPSFRVHDPVEVRRCIVHPDIRESHSPPHLRQYVYSSNTEDIQKENKSKKRKNKGKGRKRDPCLRKYRKFCIHGECRFIKSQKTPSCVCQVGYYGERCHALILPLGNPSDTYDHTTVLAVVAVVLSSFCLIVISSLLILRCHRRGAYNVENGERLKFGHPT